MNRTVFDQAPMMKFVAVAGALLVATTAIALAVDARDTNEATGSSPTRTPPSTPTSVEPATDRPQLYWAGSLYTVEVPESWLPGRPIDVGGVAPIDTRQFGDGALTVSVGSAAGDVVICGPTCSHVAGLQSVDHLAHILERDGGTVSVGSGSVGGFRTNVVRTRSASNPSVAHIGFMWRVTRPVVITLHYGQSAAPAEKYTRVVESIQFTDAPAASSPPPVLDAPDGSFRLDLPAPWRAAWGPTADAVYATRGAATQLAVYVGDAEGRVRNCDPVATSTGADTASGWERCDEVTITSLDDVRSALALHPISYGPGAAYADLTLDGEPGVVQHSRGYEYPARGGQNLAYIVAFHHGRPYVIRIWTSNSDEDALHIGDVLDAFHFTD